MNNTDNLGSVRLIVAAGEILNEIDYDNFLNITSETPPAAGDRFKGAGREWEQAVDLYFNRPSPRFLSFSTPSLLYHP